MSRAETMSAASTAIGAGTSLVADGGEAFSFGDPEPVLDRRQLLDLLECWHNGRWYEPPLPLDGLARAFRASPHHESAITYKVNLLAASLEPTPLLSRTVFRKAALDYLIFGNAYLEPVRSVLGNPIALRHAMARYTRRGMIDGQYWWVPGVKDAAELAPGVVHVAMPDINQELYGVPQYLSALQSALLNEAATLFRRKYYLNGSHAGYILYATGEIDQTDMGALKRALAGTKGPGNFRNLLVHAPNAKEGSLKLLPIAEAGAKDEFLGIKDATRDDVLAVHRVPPVLLGIVPRQGSALSKPADAMETFWPAEIEPIQAAFLEINDQVPGAVRFKERIAAEPA